MKKPVRRSRIIHRTPALHRLDALRRGMLVVGHVAERCQFAERLDSADHSDLDTRTPATAGFARTQTHCTTGRTPSETVERHSLCIPSVTIRAGIAERSSRAHGRGSARDSDLYGANEVAAWMGEGNRLGEWAIRIIPESAASSSATLQRNAAGVHFARGEACLPPLCGLLQSTSVEAHSEEASCSHA